MVTFSTVRAALSRIKRRRTVAAQVTRELRAMTDHELNDLGISHARISTLAREAAAKV